MLPRRPLGPCRRDRLTRRCHRVVVGVVSVVVDVAQAIGRSWASVCGPWSCLIVFGSPHDEGWAMYTGVRARPPSAARRTYGGSGSQGSHAVRLAWAWRRAMRCCVLGLRDLRSRSALSSAYVSLAWCPDMHLDLTLVCEGQPVRSQ